MAGRDKQLEFLANLDRFVFLSEFYRWNRFPPNINKAFDDIIEYVQRDFALRKEMNEAQEIINEDEERYSMMRKKEFLRVLLDEL